MTPEEAAALLAGGEMDLDLRGSWPGTPAVRRCAVCEHEQRPGAARTQLQARMTAEIDLVHTSDLAPLCR